MDTSDLQCWVDGSATYVKGDGRPNNGPNAVCHSMFSLWAGTKCLEEHSQQIGYATVNSAEFVAIIMGIAAALAYEPKKLVVYCDSQVAVNAINNRNYNCTVAQADEMIRAIWQAVEKLDHFKLVWVKRHRNRADGLNRKLAKEAAAQP